MPGNVEVTGLELKVTANIGNTVETLDRLQKSLSGLDSKKLSDVSVALKGLGEAKISKDIAHVGNAVINFNTALNAVDTKSLHNQANNLKKALTPLANILDRISAAAKGLDFTGVAKAAQAINKAGLGTNASTRRSTSATTAPVSTLAMRTDSTSTPIERIVSQRVSDTLNTAINQTTSSALIPTTIDRQVSQQMSDMMQYISSAMSRQATSAMRESMPKIMLETITNGLFGQMRNSSVFNAPINGAMGGVYQKMASSIMSNVYRQVGDALTNVVGTPKLTAASSMLKLPAIANSTLMKASISAATDQFKEIPPMIIDKIKSDLAEGFRAAVTSAKTPIGLPAVSSAGLMGMGGARPATAYSGRSDLNFFGQTPKVSVWARIKELLTGSAKAAKQTAEGVKEAGEEGEQAESKFAKMSKALMYGGSMKTDLVKTFNDVSKVIGKVGSAFIKAGSAMASFAKGPLSMVFNPFRNLAATIKDATTRFTKFFAALKRVAIYRAIRGLLKAVTQGLKEGIENLYQWSKITGGDFAAAMDMIATASLYVKNSLAAMVSPIITYVAPAIDMLADKFVALLNIMNQFFARITGRATWTEALKYPTEYAENTAGAAKKIKDNIQDFDELHILRTPNAGGGGDNLDYNNMFRESEFTNEFSNWIEEFKRALRNSQFYEAGSILATAVNDLFENRIPWGDIGDTVGQRVSSVFQFALGFLRTFNFVGMGADIATFLNHAIDSLDANAVGGVFAYKIQSIVDIAFGFVSTADWGGYGRKISDFVTGWFETIDGARIGQTISTAIHGALTFVESFLEDDYKWDLIAEDIAGLINNIDWLGILTRTLHIGAKIIQAILRVIRRAITGEQAEGPVSQVFESTDLWRIDYLTSQANGTLNEGISGIGDSISDSIASSISSADFMDVAEAFKDVLEAAWDLAWEVVKFSLMKPGEKIAEAVSDAWTGGHWEQDIAGNYQWQEANQRSFGQVFARGSERFLFGGVGENLIHGIGNFDLLSALGRIGSRSVNTPIATASNPIAALLSALGIGGSTQGRRSGGTANLSNRYAKTPNYDTSAKSMARFAEETKKQEYNLTELYKMSETSSAHMAEHWENSASKIEGRVTAKFESTKERVSATITSLTSESGEKFNELGTSLSTSLSGVANAMVSPLNEIKGQITGAFSEAGNITKEDIGNLSDVMVTSLKGVYDASAPEVTKVNVLWSSLKDNMKTAGNGIIDIAEKVGNSIIDAFNAMGDNLKSYDGLTFPDGTRINLASVKKSPKLNIPRLATGGLVTSPTVAMVGEAGREAILPLDNNTGWMDEFSERMGGGAEEIALLREQNDLLRQIAAKKTGITPNEVFNAVRDENRDYFVRTGNNALIM